MTDPNAGKKKRQTLYVHEWPKPDRLAWQDACRPTVRLKKGGAASHLTPVSQEDIGRRYGQFLGFLKATGHLNSTSATAGHVTPRNVANYLKHLEARKVRSVTVWNCIYKLRRAAQLLSPNDDFTWLCESEKDIALVMEPRSKLDRFVYPERLVKAGLTLIIEANNYARAEFKRARAIRNGLMLVVLALAPSRRKNFARLEIGKTFSQIGGRWWVTISSDQTKSRRRPEERPLPDWVTPHIDLYINEARPVLLTGSKQDTKALWISSESRGPMTARKVGSLISQVTRQTVGIAVSPHLFRTAVATTAAEAAPEMPYLATALLAHTNSRVTEDYNRSSSLNAANTFAAMI